MSGDVFEASFSQRGSCSTSSQWYALDSPSQGKEDASVVFENHTEFSGSVQSQGLEGSGLRSSALASLDMYPSRVVDYDSNEIARGHDILA